jgi:selenocysteine lyase/cysteine desulfurase
VRLCLAFFNTEAEVDRVADLISEIGGREGLA